MIKAENLRIGDLVRVSAKCAFDKGTICTVVAVSNVFYCKKQRGIVELRPINSYEMPQGVGSCDIEGIPLTPAILEKMWIEKWDGSVPTVVTGGNTSTFLDLSKIQK